MRSVSSARIYSLKAAIMARALAEITVLTILTLLPVLLLIAGYFFSLHTAVKIAICILSPVSISGLWGLFRIPFRIELDESGLRARSISHFEFLKWNEMKTLRLRSYMGSKQYSLIHEHGELCFPYMFNKVSELAAEIRRRLPNSGRSVKGAEQLYNLPKASFLLETSKLLFQAAFCLLFGFFACSFAGSGKSSQEDAITVLVVAVIFILLLFWNFLQILRLPHEVSLNKEGLQLKGLLGKTTLPWNEITGLSPTGLFYPDGVMISLSKRRQIIGSCLDGYDELFEEISSRISAGRLS